MKSPHLLSLTAAGALTSIATLHAVEVDPGFAPQVNGVVHALALDSSGQIIAGGEFSQVNGTSRFNLARLTPAGALDSGFNPPAPDGPVLSLATAADGKIALAGGFSVPGPNFARLHPDGQPDTTIQFGSGTSGRIDCLAIPPDGSTLFGGSFRRLNGTPALYVGKLTAAGQVDSSFQCGLQANPSLEAGADALALQSDGKLIVGGNVSTENGFAYLVRLNTDGSLDPTFSGDHGPILYPKAILVLPNGAILVGGTADSTGAGFVRRLHPDGSVDQAFHEAAFDGTVEALAVDAQGRIVAGGSFSGNLARLRADGSIDPDWTIHANGLVKTICLQEDGAVLIGGAFTQVDGEAHRGLARLIQERKITATNSNGRFIAHVQGESGATYRIEASNDLRVWTAFGVATAGPAGVQITDPGAGAARHKFFRVTKAN